MSYGDLINIDDFGEKRENFVEDRGDVSFFCKDCREIVETNRKKPRGFIFVCKKCNGKNIALGTLEGLKANYKIKG